jgi:hypothetical protein
MCCLCCVGSLEGDRTRTGNFVGKEGARERAPANGGASVTSSLDSRRGRSAGGSGSGNGNGNYSRTKANETAVKTGGKHSRLNTHCKVGNVSTLYTPSRRRSGPWQGRQYQDPQRGPDCRTAGLSPPSLTPHAADARLVRRRAPRTLEGDAQACWHCITHCVFDLRNRRTARAVSARNGEGRLLGGHSTRRAD